MQVKIRHMEEKDRICVIDMMRVFYASPAVLSNGSEEIFEADVDACVGESPYLEGYIFEGHPLIYITVEPFGNCLFWKPKRNHIHVHGLLFL